jgi:hypothetical protein
VGKKVKIPKKLVDGTSWTRGTKPDGTLKDKGQMTIDLWVTQAQYNKLTDRLMK